MGMPYSDTKKLLYYKLQNNIVDYLVNYRWG
jgi:hypothetical protein